MSEIDLDAARLCQNALTKAGVKLPLLRSDEPVFSEPWQAQAFALTLALHERGMFSWNQWAQTLSDCIKTAQERGDADRGSTYYHHWLAALEQITLSSKMFSKQQLQARQTGWREAVARTPHGMPIELSEEEKTLPDV